MKRTVTTGVLVLAILFTTLSCKNKAATTTTAAAPATTAPAAFTISAATAGIGTVDLSWATSTGADSYTVKYGTTTGTYGTTFSTAATSPTTITGLTFGTTYYFMVTAVNTIGSTNATAEDSASPLGGMNCYAGSIGNQSAYQIHNASPNYPISYLTQLTGNHITKIEVPLFLQDPANANLGGTAYVGTITLSAYSCVTHGGAPTTGTLLGSTPATYAHQVSAFSLSTIGAGTQGDMTDFDFSGSPLTIPTSCSAGQDKMAFVFTSSGFASEWVMGPESAASSSCFLTVSTSATTVSSGTTNSFQAIITVD